MGNLKHWSIIKCRKCWRHWLSEVLFFEGVGLGGGGHKVFIIVLSWFSVKLTAIDFWLILSTECVNVKLYVCLLVAFKVKLGLLKTWQLNNFQWDSRWKHKIYVHVLNVHLFLKIRCPHVEIYEFACFKYIIYVTCTCTYEKISLHLQTIRWITSKTFIM